MQRRTGLTLIEVLVAIFIMGIGLIALLTLFPIGILRMAQAIRDERTAQAYGQANSLANLHDVRHDPLVTTFAGNFSEPAIADLFVNPYPVLPGGAKGLPDADPFGESYPVFADPVGYLWGPGGAKDWVGGAPGYLRRRPVQYVQPGTVNQDRGVFNWFTVTDDLTFDSVFDGNPANPTQRPGTPKVIAPLAPNAAVPTIQRDPRYSWAYLLRRPQTGDRSVVDCSIVVFDKRPLTPTGSLALTEFAYPNTSYFDPVKNTITIDVSATIPPNVRPGDWIYDGTIYQTSATTGSAHAYFYRVVAVEDLAVGASRYVRYEVQTPLRGFTNFPTIVDPTNPSNVVCQGTAIYMEGVAEVFEQGPVRAP